MNVSLVGLSVGALIIVNVVAASFQEAFRSPLKDVGADLTVQLSGDVPEKMVGLVLPCSVAPIHRKDMEEIGRLKGVQSMSEALLMWDFDPKGFKVVLGFDPEADSGPGLLKNAVLSGTFLKKGEARSALVDSSFSSSLGIRTGDSVVIQGAEFSVAGVVDGSRIGKIAPAQVYLTLADARKIAADAPAIKAVHTFNHTDSNLLFISADRDKTTSIDQGIKKILGAKASVSSPDSFREMLGSLFSLTDRFAWMVSAIALIVAFLLVGRTAAANVRERKAEIGTMKAVGWRTKEVVRQLEAESVIQVFLGGVLGILIGVVASEMLAFVKISIPIPWEMSPRPHFLPGGGDQLYRATYLPISISPVLVAASLGACLLIGIVGAWVVARKTANLKPAEVLDHE